MRHWSRVRGPLRVGLPAPRGLLAAVLALAVLGVLGTVQALASAPTSNQWGDLNRGQPIPEQNAKEELGKAEPGTAGADDRASTAWRYASLKASVVVGALDTGVEYEHADLAPDIWSNPGELLGCEAGTRGFNVIEGAEKRCNPLDEDSAFAGHGTNVAGIIAATGKVGEGVQGVDPRATVLPVKWLKSAGAAPSGETALVEAIDQLLAEKKEHGVNVRVVNDSPVFPGSSQPAVKKAIEELGAQEILFVTAAGNNGGSNDSVPHYPCSYGLPNEICVTASNNRDQLPAWANWGEKSVDLAAPGESIWSTQLGGTYGYLSGGSMAAAQVSGAAALLLSVEPNLKMSELRQRIVSNVRVVGTLEGKVRTKGVLDVCKALPSCREPTPSAETAGASAGQTSATLEAKVNPNGYKLSECVFQYGLSAPSYGSEAGCSSSAGEGTSPVSVAVALTKLSPATTYHYRIVTRNPIGSQGGTGEDHSFKTEAAPPSVTTEGASSRTHTTATLNATVNPNGSNVKKCFFEYGLLSAKGTTAPCATAPGGGVAPVPVTAALSGLEPDTTYHFRVVAENEKGSVSGGEVAFTTVPLVPAAVTAPATSVSETGAALNASVNPNGAQMRECFFEYGTSISYGSKAECAASPAEGTTAVAVSAALSGLTQGTTYHYRIVAVNSSGKQEGDDATFTTVAHPAPPPPPVELASPPPSQGTLPFVQESPPKPTGARLVLTTLIVSHAGVVVVTLTCPASEGTCSGAVALRTLAATAARRPSIVLATASFSIAAGHSKSIKLRLSTRAKQALGRSRTVRGRSTTLTHATGGVATSTQTIVLKMPH